MNVDLDKIDKVYKIRDNIYIGPISVFYTKVPNNFDVIVNCTKEKYDHNANYYYEVPVDDTECPTNIDAFVLNAKKILPDILKHYNDKRQIYVHCSQGVQRSAAFVAYLLINIISDESSNSTQCLSLDEAINMILIKKPNCFAHGRQVNFMEALKRLCHPGAHSA